MRRRSIMTAASMLVLAVASVAAAQPEHASEPRQRALVDQPETAGGACDCTHLIYFVPADGIDRALDTNGTISASVRSMRAWFALEMQMAPRIDLLGTSQLYDITFVRGSQPAAGYPDMVTLTDELIERGYDDPAKRYLVYAQLDRGDTCGESTFGYPVLPGISFAVIYLDSAGCQGSDFGKGTVASAGVAETIGAHEWLHLEGIVPPAAPHHCPLSLHHVCTGGLHLIAEITGVADPEWIDVMYPYTRTKLGEKVLDRERDDYLDHGVPLLLDLRASIWLEPAA